MPTPLTAVTVPPLILASSSPRRSDVLASLGVAFRIQPADVDEQWQDGEGPGDMVLRLAAAKACAIDARGEIVLGADTAVVVDGEVFGKPRHQAEALAMLARLSGRAHRVLTGIAVRCPAMLATALSNTEVRFRDIAPDEALRYWQSGEPRGKAGAYAIQGLGGAFVESIEGSYTGVVGLPVFETARLLGRAGIEVLPRSDG